VTASAETRATEGLGPRALGRLERRARIAEAAEAVFREKGYAAAGMRLIAARAGVSVGTVFEYARDKRSLLLLVFGRNFELFTQRAIATLDRSAPLIDQLIHIYRERYQFFLDDINVSLPLLQEISFFFQDDAANDPESPIAQYLEKRAAGRKAIVELIAAHQAAGCIDARHDARDIASVIIAVHQVEMREWLGRGTPTVEAGLKRLRSLLEIALSGVLRAPGSAEA
jgi:AcrR family transcriptional regulator